MRVLRDKEGKIMVGHMQSHAREGTVLKNALASGLLVDDVIETECTQAEWDAAMLELARPGLERIAKQKAYEETHAEAIDALLSGDHASIEAVRVKRAELARQEK